MWGSRRGELFECMNSCFISKFISDDNFFQTFETEFFYLLSMILFFIFSKKIKISKSKDITKDKNSVLL